MQSLIQYRKFRRNLQGQIDRYGLEKVASAFTTDSQHISSVLDRVPHSSGTLQASADVRDRALEEKETENSNAVRDHISQTEDVLGDQYNRRLEPRQTDRTELTTHSTTCAPRPSLGNEGDEDEDLSDSTDVPSDLEPEPIRPTTSVGSRLRETGTQLGRYLTGVSVKSHQQKHDPAVKEHYFVVGYEGPDDPLNPRNWSTTRRLVYTILIALIGFIVGLASSIDSAAAAQFVQEFGVSEVVESLATGLFLIGFGCGAFFAAPFSETVGRNPVYLITGVLYMIFVMASALSPNIGAQLAFRFIAGFFGSTPLTCAGGSLSDMWTSVERTKTFPIFAQAAFLGPVIGPVVGGWIGQSVLSPRWTDWITLIWSGLIFGLVFLFLPETYAPVLLKWKAEHLRTLTGDNRYKSALEVGEVQFKDRLIQNLYRPWILIFSEPIVILFTLYLSVVYIVLFTFLTGFEFIFEDIYGVSQGLTFSIFIALAIGLLMCTPLVPWVVKRYRSKQAEAEKEGKTSLPPEQRLVFAMIGCPFLPIGLFWMAWTAYPTISIWSPICACVPIGFGILSIFLTTYQYLIDAFEAHAASALVGITFVRYTAAGGMLPVSIPFYRNLGVHWTLTILGAIATIMVPVPYLFFVFGERIRGKSRHAVGGSANTA